MCNRVARSLFDIGDQAGICAQLFYVKERSYGFEQELDVAIKVVMVMKDMICKKRYRFEYTCMLIIERTSLGYM